MTTHTRTTTRRSSVAVLATTLLALVGFQAAPAHAATGPARTAAGAPRTALATAAPAGHLVPTGCSFGTGTATCDLYAATGTATFLGQSVPIWGFASNDTAAPTAPGPLLVVHQGDQVTIQLHNGLAGEDVSLALPGQRHVQYGTSSVGDDVTGVATGGSRSYTFTADRPGTFTYEAGHTPNGTRQVAMGLAGALVVLPSTAGSAYGNASGYPDTSYDDESVLVLSEIDPRLNADPAHFDMREFSPRFRLINGKPFPETDAVSTDQGHRVLLRYVNVGSQAHSMSTLGANQLEVAQDGHPMRYAETTVAENVVPGATIDTLVTVPSGPESKIAVYEAATRLSNDGQHSGDPLQLAFGGMLTFLDTQAPPPSSDAVGPTSKHVAVSPNPASGQSDVTVTADLSDATTGGSNVVEAEYVLDDDSLTGVGFATAMTAPAFGSGGAVDVTATGTLTVAQMAGIEAGKHTIFVRAKDAAGNWGAVGSVIFNLPKTGPLTSNGSATDNPTNGASPVDITATGDDRAAGGTIDDAEYFLDTVGDNGSGQPMTINRQASLVSLSATLPAATVRALGDGPHVVWVHSHDSLGLWGPPHSVELMVDLTGPTVQGASVGPNPTNGLVSATGNSGNLVVSAQIADVPGTGGASSKVVDAEAFLDPPAGSVPAGGTGLQLIAVDGAMDSGTEAVYGLIPLSQIRPLSNGTHRVFVRGQDAAGTWGELFPVDLVVDKTAPVLGALSATPNPTNGATALTLTAPVTETGSSVQAAEVWFGTADPGVGRGTSVTLAVSSGTVTVTAPLTGVASGNQQVNLRVRDQAGNWSNAVAKLVTVQRPNAIFSNGFESGTAGWSSVTGPVSVTSAAGIPVAAGNSGMAVTLPTTGARTPRYVTDTSPVAEPTYHAQFAFNPSTLTGGTITVFRALNPSGGQAAAVQMRRSGTAVQVRAVANRSTGTAMNGTWVTLTGGAHTLRVDWAAATAGSLRLAVDGTTVQTLSVSNATVRIETVQLGAVTVTSTTHGTAYFDAFVSTRTTLP